MASRTAGSSHGLNPPKRTLLDDSDCDSEAGGAQLEESDFRVNEEYARRFEHNKKREERHKLEEKFKGSGKDQDDDEDDESSSSNETEDEDGFLATEDLDAQISATLHAIRNKDPRLYDKDYKFINLADEDTAGSKEKKETPVFLRDYQRQKLLQGDAGASDDDDEDPVQQTYAEEQEALRKRIVSEMNASGAVDGSDGSDDSDDDDFMKKKAPAKVEKTENGVHPSRAPALKISNLDVTNADRDPETYLSNFLSARAWIPEEGGRWKAFESDEGEDDDRADEFEQAYNMRFEDPEKSNEVLQSYARDFAAARSVRREEKTGRQRQRELEKEKKEAEARQRREAKARLRKLKLEETEEKLRKVKQAAGAVGKELSEQEWMKFLDEAWENDKWEEEMQKRFGDEYYAMEDDAAAASDDEDDDNGEKRKRKKKKHPKKPKWDDDIDIKDLVPDFEDDNWAKRPVTLGGDDDDDDDDGDIDGDNDGDNDGNNDGDNETQDPDAAPSKKRKTLQGKRARLESQKQARKERSKLEALVDSKLELDNHELLGSKSEMAFRYRETSPQAFGMTARDILLAPSDKDLNEFFGLKKLATFRDAEKKRRDKKRLGKKARLREWRRSTFGKEFEKEGPTYGFERAMGEEDAVMDEAPGKPAVDGSGHVLPEVGARRKKRKRSKGKKKGGAEEDE
ncbi:ribosome biogenesis protein Kri1 [Metarhizium album ARSEF 1941]|uniref:Ribosome biogenesis protein Kri1 n=1 Tax=Metarhizium album (strain ARSEF 1941) TaxID=1081103 RepID=A0A0B2X2Y9_METAS|nr:ribosome biogenesis protein Kri1 [Metarhizium album ARSEF 1941]KHO00694.1 ribosome biogenesis protein Kri1 [Metarhizium album ARSEF 1941]